MSLSRLGALAAVALGVVAAAVRCPAADAPPAWCLPPIFEGGERLHAVPTMTAFWLPALLRQHQLCHAARAHPDEPRAVLLGSSAVVGHPHPAEESLSAQLNEQLGASDVPGRVFNLGFVLPYELRDALVLHAALDYQPDLIIYATTLADFAHFAPMPFPAITAFFEANDTTVHELARTGLPGLDEPLQKYDALLNRRLIPRGHMARLRDLGSLVRAAARAHADALALWFDPTRKPPRSQRPPLRRRRYNCDETLKDGARRYWNWQSWNILAYLEQVRDATGAAVLVVNLPVRHEPVGECYNERYSAERVFQFDGWLRSQCTERQFAYVDLHALLPSEEFSDSMHPTPEGHRRVAEALAPTVECLLRPRPR